MAVSDFSFWQCCETMRIVCLCLVMEWFNAETSRGLMMWLANIRGRVFACVWVFAHNRVCLPASPSGHKQPFKRSEVTPGRDADSVLIGVPSPRRLRSDAFVSAWNVSARCRAWVPETVCVFSCVTQWESEANTNLLLSSTHTVSSRLQIAASANWKSEIRMWIFLFGHSRYNYIPSCCLHCVRRVFKVNYKLGLDFWSFILVKASIYFNKDIN